MLMGEKHWILINRSHLKKLHCKNKIKAWFYCFDVNYQKLKNKENELNSIRCDGITMGLWKSKLKRTLSKTERISKYKN